MVRNHMSLHDLVQRYENVPADSGQSVRLTEGSGNPLEHDSVKAGQLPK